jgi:Na+/H+ antiporter NhaA
MEGVKTSMLVALSLLSFLGLRYPLKMLPILLFELGWKAIWVAVVVLPLWRADQLDAATLQVFYSCLVVLIVAAVVPWRHVVGQYVCQQSDPWRSGTTSASRGKRS